MTGFPFDVLPFQPTDAAFEEVAGIFNTHSPLKSVTTEELKSYFLSRAGERDGHFRHHVMAIAGGRIVGFGHVGHLAHAFDLRKMYLWIGVEPAAQEAGIGRCLYDALITSLALRRPLEIRTQISERSARAVAFVTARGFSAVEQVWEISRDLQSPEIPSPDLAHPLTPDGEFTFITVAEERGRDPGWLRKLYELEMTIRMDEPWDIPYTPDSFEHYEQNIAAHSTMLWEGSYLVKHGEEWIGLSYLEQEKSGEEAYQQLTGVLRPFRRRGLASALERRVMAFARARGFHTIRAWVHAVNAPSLALQERLGYQRRHSLITFSKSFP